MTVGGKMSGKVMMVSTSILKGDCQPASFQASGRDIIINITVVVVASCMVSHSACQSWFVSSKNCLLRLRLGELIAVLVNNLLRGRR